MKFGNSAVSIGVGVVVDIKHEKGTFLAFKHYNEIEMRYVFMKHSNSMLELCN